MARVVQETAGPGHRKFAAGLLTVAARYGRRVVCQVEELGLHILAVWRILKFNADEPLGWLGRGSANLPASYRDCLPRRRRTPNAMTPNPMSVAADGSGNGTPRLPRISPVPNTVV